MKGVDILKEQKTRYRIKRRINEKEDVIVNLLEQRGKYLIVSGTDTGKTYTFLADDGIFKYLAKRYEDRNFIIACPNRIQNLQNKEQYKVFALVGGERYDITKRITSMVYEKGEDVLKAFKDITDKEFTIIIDEAHQLMLAEDYRKEAIETLDKLRDMAYSSVHLTATPETLIDYYDYNEILRFELIDPSIGNNLDKLYVVPCNDIKISLLQQVKNIVKSKKQVIVMIDSKESILEFEEFFKREGLNVATVTSDNKRDNLVYNSIIMDSLIPSDCNILLTTSALECGTNIKNTNVVMLVVIPRKDRFNAEKVEQAFARLRVKNEYSVLLINNYEQKEKYVIEEKSVIAKKLDFELKRALADAEEFLNLMIKQGNSKEEVCNLVKGHLGLTKLDGTKVGKGILEVNEELCKVEINKKAFIVRVCNMYYAQFLDKKDELLKCLKEHVKADKIIYSDTYINTNEEDLESFTAIQQASNEIKETIKDKARNIIRSFDNDDVIFEQFIVAPEVLDISGGVTKENEDKFNFLKREKKQLALLSDMINVKKIPFKIAMSIYKNYDKPSNISSKASEYIYIETNKKVPLLELEGLNMRYEYGLIRRNCDKVCKKQGKITPGLIEEIVEDLLMYGEFTKLKAWEKYKNAKTKKEKEKRFVSVQKDILTRISKIYNVIEVGNYFKVSSLKKDFNC